ncbi:E3 ubiquitin-protein ligase UPL6-like isoform X1 [Papaver somniferum]|uniref:E3 ubiquitin-protein ligase UPL6-like isoform X1 n=1 Tax=Papaver somniferum TaxID=3469 RepID=UPI000E6F993D|nr:E3 ubiquitin-protein ligase UPL6-like isoform X1 [Papaver somniferum]
MFFSGDSTRKRVDLGGRSSKETDRKKVLEQSRLERQRRQELKQKNASALKIQKCYRGRKVVEGERNRVRDEFKLTYGEKCQKVDRRCFDVDSGFLSKLLFFFKASNGGDFLVLVETCRILRRLALDSGDLVSLFASTEYSLKRAAVEHRVKRLANICLQAVHQNRYHLKDQLMLSSEFSDTHTVVLLEAVILLTNSSLPWACIVASHLQQTHAFALLRDIILTEAYIVKTRGATGKGASSLEHVLTLIVRQIGEQRRICSVNDSQWSFSSQILTIPFLWRRFSYLKDVFATQGLVDHYIHEMSLCVRSHTYVLPDDISREFPGYACLLGNFLEVAGVSLSRPNCSFDMGIDFATVSTFLLEALPPLRSLDTDIGGNSTPNEDEMDVEEEVKETIVMDLDLERQISNAINPRLLQQLVNVLFRGASLLNGLERGLPHDQEMAAVGAVCSFLHITFNTVPVPFLITGLAYRTELVQILWNFIKRCHENQRWPASTELTANHSGEVPGWLLPLAVFCPIYTHMLLLVGNDEFYEQEKPLTLNEIRSLVIILKQALWQLLWVIPSKSPNVTKTAVDFSSQKKHSTVFLQHRVNIVTSELLTQLQDWNNRRQFTTPSNFHAQEAVDELFISQALTENSRAYDILRQAPFLVPFTSRVKIFTTQLAASRQRHGQHVAFTRNRFRIRRDRIFEDAFNQLSALSEEDLRGVIRVTFVNEFGVEEAGIDGGGIFKDFMENITRAAFNVQYGLFKETADHLLYPNPGSGLVHEQHYNFFYFLGVVLGKAMFEGILVDIPFATFFLSKLKQKHNYLNDLPSLDPELYRHLIFLKHYKGDISALELYFVIVSNEYGEQTEEELILGGKEIRVTNENVIRYIHLIATHRLNIQIRRQSTHFLRGFSQLIQKDWISMFNEHELQLLISGSLEGLDVDDLRSHTHYSGGYHADHYVIEMFWGVVKSFSLENQKKFLKFVTGCSRGPLLGFKYLEPQFCIQRAAGDASEEALDRLPTSATCMNLLKLPPYRSKEQLENKLMYAINADAGFDLS